MVASVVVHRKMELRLGASEWAEMKGEVYGEGGAMFVLSRVLIPIYDGSARQLPESFLWFALIVSAPLVFLRSRL